MLQQSFVAAGARLSCGATPRPTSRQGLASMVHAAPCRQLQGPAGRTAKLQSRGSVAVRAAGSKHPNVSAGRYGVGWDAGGGLWVGQPVSSRGAASCAPPRPPLRSAAPALFPSCRHSRCMHASGRLQILQVDAEGLEAEIMNRDRPLIIDFYATWSAPAAGLPAGLAACLAAWLPPCLAACLLAEVPMQRCCPTVSCGSRGCRCTALLPPGCFSCARVQPDAPAPPASCPCRCGPCVLLAKELETVAEKLGEAVRILKIDTDANPDISTQLQVRWGRLAAVGLAAAGAAGGG